MCGRILNEDDFVEIDDLVETDQFVPSSDFVLAVAISQKMTPSASALEERERQYDFAAQRNFVSREAPRREKNEKIDENPLVVGSRGPFSRSGRRRRLRATGGALRHWNVRSFSYVTFLTGPCKRWG